MRKLFSSESVTEGHPDKICDQISDAVLDAILEKDPTAHVACECTVTTGQIMVMGEISTSCFVDIAGIARRKVLEIGYDRAKYGFDGSSCAVLVCVDEQSPDIAMGVNNALEGRESNAMETGAGDQGMMFGYACDETPEYMPMPIALAHRITRRMAEVRKSGLVNYMRPDGKAQVTVEYDGDKPVRVDTVVLSTQHAPDVTHEQIEKDMIELVIKKVIPAELIDENTRFLINPTGRFVVGGPQGDSEEWVLVDGDYSQIELRLLAHISGDETMIRAGLGRWIAAPFECLLESEEVYYPPVDLVEMFLTLADKYGMAFYFGMYDSGKYWQEGLFRREIDLNLKLIDEVWARYGHHKSFQGWYLSQEISRRTKNMSRIYAEVGRHAKAVSGGLKTMISPYIHGIKTDQVMAGDKALSVEEHRREWNEILGNVAGAVDILAFQDGQVDYRELYDYLVVNKALADKYGMECWTNIESFDRDMPIRFLPIKWEKLLLKLDAARRAGMQNVITFEFSHFMSPNSAYPQAGHLYDRYCDYFKIDNPYRKR